MDSAPRGTDEMGTPAYEVIGNEALGLDSAPTDLRELPDGRILLVAGTQLALGDGVRWDVFNQDKSRPVVRVSGAAVDQDGSIYVGLNDGVAKVEFAGNGTWQPHLVAAWAEAGPAAASQPMPQAAVALVGGDWIWHSLTGPLLSWRPGQPMRLRGYMNTFEHVFRFGGDLYTSDRGEGVLSRIEDGKSIPLEAGGSFSAITCSVPLDEHRLLVGTYGRGLRVFDGRTVSDFAADELFSNGGRINDLCRTEGGYLAAALDNDGIIFFGRDGRAVQVLDRETDNRMARVKKLLPGRGGILWGLWDGGILRVQFPARVSHFESLIPFGLTTGHPFRCAGTLWLLADGRLYRAVYNRDHRLVRLALDSPAGLFVNAFSNVDGRAVAGTEAGAFVRTERGWTCFAPEAVYFRVVRADPAHHRWLFVARDTVGWMDLAGDTPRIVATKPVPGLSNVFNKPVADKDGNVWLELAVGRVARVQVNDGTPEVRIFTEHDGLPPNWPQLFLDDGVLAAHVSDEIVRYDSVTQRFVADPAFLASIPGVQNVFGRPGVDPQGRLWIVADGILQVRLRHGKLWDQVATTIPLNYQPYFLTFEDNGTAWLHGLHRLSRVDPAIADVPAVPLAAQLTELSVAGGKKVLFDFKNAAPALDYTRNSVVAHFVARGNPLGAAVTFEIRLEGASSGSWVNVGSAGLASLDHLKEGQYVLHVRPRLGGEAGAEDAVAFTIHPPWFRTPLAYVAYALSLLLAATVILRLSRALELREKRRLERLVADRTSELSLSNAKLAAQMDEIRFLTQAITQSPVAVFITDPEGRIEYVNPRSSLMTGRPAEDLLGRDLRQLRPPAGPSSAAAEIAAALARNASWSGQTALLHKDGHAVPVRSTVSLIFAENGSVRHHVYLEDDITEWLTDQDRRRRLETELAQAQRIESVGRLAGGIAHDFNNILTGILGYCELAKMSADQNGDVRPDLQEIRAAGLRAKDLVDRILSFSRKTPSGSQTVIDLRRPVQEALRLVRATTPATIQLSEDLAPGNCRADATQIHQIVVNLCTNAVHAIGERPGTISVQLRPCPVDATSAAETTDLKAGAYLRLSVSDDGHGMEARVLEHVFDPFFTTKPQGQGTGLGLSIVRSAVESHGGAVRVRSALGKGTTFDLYFPVSEQPAEAPSHSVPPTPGQGEEILLVDDEPMVAEFALAALTNHGYRPAFYNDPLRALSGFRAAPDRFSAVVTDLTMPHLTGVDLLNTIRAQRPAIPAIILTGFGSDNSREAIARLPRCILLQKPFTSDDLARALSAVLHDPRAEATPAANST